jgi:hypothetical protein
MVYARKQRLLLDAGAPRRGAVDLAEHVRRHSVEHRHIDVRRGPGAQELGVLR